MFKAVAYCLLLDRLAGEVTGALARRGIRSVLLKGPAVAKWLYRDGSPRRYEDIDLLVAPDQFREAEHVLSEHGFGLAGTTFHAHTWLREGDAAVVDLHWAIIGVGARPEDAWNVLTSDTEALPVGDAVVEVLSMPARALHVALHAVQHPWRERQSLIDLERALEQSPPDVWQRAAELGRRLDAEPALAAGLRLLPAGRDLSEALRLSETVSVDVALRAEKPPPLTLALEHLASTPGVSGKLRFGLDRVFLSPEKLRAASPLARHGRVGLLMAYPARTLRMCAQAGPALAVWLGARRRARAR